jgi:hypothetical protein
MRLVVSFYFKIDTNSTQTPKNRHKMQKIDTKNIALYTRIVRATVNQERKLRVYINQERMGDFDTMQEAIKYIRHETNRNLCHLGCISEPRRIVPVCRYRQLRKDLSDHDA